MTPNRTVLELLNEAIKQIECIHVNADEVCMNSKYADFIRSKAAFARGAVRDAAATMGLHLDT